MTISIAFLFSIDFFYIYIYCRKFNAEFNNLIKTVGHRDRFFQKTMVNTPTFANNFDFYLDIFTLSLIKSLSCNNTLNRLGLYVWCIID